MATENAYNPSEYTIEDYLFGCVNLAVPSELLIPILLKRDVEPQTVLADIETKTRRLLEADLYAKIALTTPDKVSSTTDSDNGWQHTGGGFSISDDYRNLLLAEANKIYAEYGEPAVGKNAAFRITSHGIQRARIGMDGEPLPHVIKK